MWVPDAADKNQLLQMLIIWSLFYKKKESAIDLISRRALIVLCGGFSWLASYFLFLHPTLCILSGLLNKVFLKIRLCFTVISLHYECNMCLYPVVDANWYSVVLLLLCFMTISTPRTRSITQPLKRCMGLMLRWVAVGGQPPCALLPASSAGCSLLPASDVQDVWVALNGYELEW